MFTSGNVRPPYERTRSKDDRTSVPRRSRWYNSTSGPGVWNDYPVANGVGTIQHMTDTVTPAFRYLSARGLIINKPMSSSKTTVSTTSTGPMFQVTIGSVTYTGDLDGYGWVAGLPSLVHVRSNVSAADIDHMIAETSTRALSQITTRSVQATSTVDLLEFRETARYLRNPVESGTRTARAIEKAVEARARANGYSGWSEAIVERNMGRFSKRLVQFQREAAGIWMSARYGARPLIYSMTQISEALQSLRNPPTRETFRSTLTKSTNGTFSAVEGFDGITYQANYAYSDEVVVSAGVLTERTRAYDLIEGLGLRADQIPRGLWEAVTLSWMVDWWFNVGEVLSALTPSSSYQSLSQWVTITRKRNVAQSVGSYSFPGRNTTRNGSGVNSFYEEDKSRRPVALALNVRPTYKQGALPVFSADLAKQIDTICVVIQKMTKTI